MNAEGMIAKGQRITRTGFYNCRMFVQAMVEKSDLESLPTVRTLTVGDIVQWGKNPARHWAIYIGSKNVLQVEEWGKTATVAPLSSVIAEYGPADAYRRAPSGLGSQDDRQSMEVYADALEERGRATNATRLRPMKLSLPASHDHFILGREATGYIKWATDALKQAEKALLGHPPRVEFARRQMVNAKHAMDEAGSYLDQLMQRSSELSTNYHFLISNDYFVLQTLRDKYNYYNKYYGSLLTRGVGGLGDAWAPESRWGIEIMLNDLSGRLNAEIQRLYRMAANEVVPADRREYLEEASRLRRAWDSKDTKALWKLRNGGSGLWKLTWEELESLATIWGVKP